MITSPDTRWIGKTPEGTKEYMYQLVFRSDGIYYISWLNDKGFPIYEEERGHYRVIGDFRVELTPFGSISSHIYTYNRTLNCIYGAGYGVNFVQQ